MICSQSPATPCVVAGHRTSSRGQMQTIGRPRLAASLVDGHVAIIDPLLVHPLPAHALFSRPCWTVRRHSGLGVWRGLVRLPVLRETGRRKTHRDKKSDQPSANRFHRCALTRQAPAQIKHARICLATRNLTATGLLPPVSSCVCHEERERQMKMRQLIVAGCSILVLSTGVALAGPCDTGRAASLRDAGSGPARTGDRQTTGMAGNTSQHPPTDTMNRATGDVAASSQDTQRQMQGEPTAAQQSEGAKADTKSSDKDC